MGDSVPLRLFCPEKNTLFKVIFTHNAPTESCYSVTATLANSPPCDTIISVSQINNLRSQILLKKALSVAFIFLTGCISTRTDNAFLLSLKNRGAVPLSSNNPFLAGNILLAKEMNRSPELMGFVSQRGTPAALEVFKSWSGKATIQLYYLDRNQYYTAEEIGKKSWAISGPNQIPPKGVDLLRTLTEYSQGNAALDLQRETYQSPSSLAVEPIAPKVEEPKAVTLNSIKNPEPIQIPQQTSPESVIDLIKELAAQTAEEAEVSPRGDIVHYVSFSGETLSIIARWYTLDVRNTGRISRINSLNNPSKLDIGDAIVVPSYLVKNKKMLTEPSLKAVSRAIAQSR